MSTSTQETRKSPPASPVTMSSPSSMRSPPSSLRSMVTSAQQQSTPATSPSLPHNDLLAMGKQTLNLQSSPATYLRSHDDDALTCRKHTLDVQADMRKRYRPYWPRIIPPALELRFACRSIGDTSYSDLGFEDVVDVSSFVNSMHKYKLLCQGKHKFL